MNRTTPGASRPVTAGPPEHVGLACCGDRLAALWDTADSLEVYALEASGWRFLAAAALAGLGLHARLDVLRRLRVGTILCGAMSGCVRNTMESCGITIHPWISGCREDVLAALRDNRLASLLMPGCGGRGRCAGNTFGAGKFPGNKRTSRAGLGSREIPISTPHQKGD